MVFFYLSEMISSLKTTFLFFFFFVVVNSSSGLAQQFQDTFYEQWERQDTAGMLHFLHEWRKSEPYNPDVFVGFFNYYAIQTFEEEVMILPEPPSDGGVYEEIKDSLNNVRGYLSSVMVINDSILDIAFNWADQGMVKFPDRLDLRMGKVYLAIETDRMEAVRDGLQSAITTGDSILHKWKWMREEELDNGRLFLTNSVQGHLYSLFEKKDSVANAIIVGTSQLMLLQDNRQFFAITNIATVRMMEGKFSESIEWLKRANKVHPRDHIVLSNLGYCYRKLKDEKNAKRYYTDALECADESAKGEYQLILDEIHEERSK